MTDVFAENLPLYEPPKVVPPLVGSSDAFRGDSFLILIGGFSLTVRSYYAQIQAGTLDPAILFRIVLRPLRKRRRRICDELSMCPRMMTLLLGQ